MNRAIVALSFGLSLLLGCANSPPGGGGGGPSPAPTAGTSPAPAAPTTVTVKDFAFSPSTVTIPVGGTVMWKFEDPVSHTSTSDPGTAKQWDSGFLGAGATYSLKFDQAGTYPYHCTPHPNMTGQVIVQ